MLSLLRRFAAPSALVVALYACNASSGDAPGSSSSGGTLPDGAVSEDAPSGADALDDRGTSVETGSDTGAGDADAALDAPVDSPPPLPAVRFVGRADNSDANGPIFGWPGARIIAHFTGTAVNVTLNEQSLYSGPSRWDVLVDGSRTSTLTPSAGLGTYPIASALPNGEHVIELYKRTEGKVGLTQFRGFDFPSGGALLAPPATPARRIEFLGDSMTTGYGDECAASSENFTGATQNERLAFSGLVAHDLGADHHDTAYSGKGVLLNYDRADNVVFDSLFPRTLPDNVANWAFASFTPDVVWITLGGNDWDQDQGTLPPPPNLTLFTNKYVALAALVRSKYATAHIFCAIAPSLNDDYPPTYNALTNMRAAMANAVSTRNAAGDTKIYAYEFTRAIYPTDLTGCAFHGNLGLHRKMADQAIVQIKAKTMWP